MKNLPETLLIVDTYEERAEEMEQHLRKRQINDLELILVDRNFPEIFQGYFADRVARVLSESDCLMVIMNYFAGVEGKIYQTLRQIELEKAKTARRVFVSCKSGTQIKKALGGVDGFGKYINYNSEKNYYLDQLDGLFA